MEYIEVSAKTVNEAIMKACMELSLPSDQLDIQVVSEGSRGFLGIGNKPAVIKVAKKAEEVKETAKEELVKPAVKEEKAVKEAVQEKVQTEKADIEKKDSDNKPRNNDRKKDYQKKKNNRKNNHDDKREERKEAFSDVKKQEIKDKLEIVEKTEEEISAMKESAETFLSEVFSAMGLNVNLEMKYVKEGGCLEIDFSGDDNGILIGKRGQTLDSLQYLTSLVVNKKQKDYVRVKLDTEDYRRRRKETLENLARNIAQKVRKTRKSVVLEPMNPYERRIIHSTLQPNKYVETYSEGNEPYRHVVVTLKK